MSWKFKFKMIKSRFISNKFNNSINNDQFKPGCFQKGTKLGKKTKRYSIFKTIFSGFKNFNRSLNICD